ncbi:MAG: hypothetical protein WC380_06760, partial [Pedobacter sp.]
MKVLKQKTSVPWLALRLTKKQNKKSVTVSVCFNQLFSNILSAIFNIKRFCFGKTSQTNQHHPQLIT